MFNYMYDYIVLASISLIVQIAVLCLLSTGYILKNRKHYRGHGITMTTALILHLSTIFTVMVPSLLLGFTSPGIIDLTDINVILIIIHSLFGIAAASLAIWLVASWRLQANVGSCFKKKRFMLPTLTFWIVTVLLGITMYINFYATLIFA